MKLRWICALCCLLLLLGACSAAGQPQSTGRELPGPAESGKPENATVAEKIAAGATEKSLLALLTNQNTESYKSFGTPAKELDLSKELAGVQASTWLLVPLQNDMQILVERVEYHANLGFFYVTETVFDFAAKQGEHYSLKMCLPEGMPQFRITAVQGGHR